MPGLQRLLEKMATCNRLTAVEIFFPSEQAVYAAGQGWPGVLPGCQAGHCGGAGEGGQSVGTLPYSGAGAGQHAPGLTQGAGVQSDESADPSPSFAPSRKEG